MLKAGTLATSSRIFDQHDFMIDQLACSGPCLAQALPYCVDFAVLSPSWCVWEQTTSIAAPGGGSQLVIKFTTVVNQASPTVTLLWSEQVEVSGQQHMPGHV